jgi:transcription-repair coupling factor (superfamily II helicase)
MEINQITRLYARLPQVGAFAKLQEDESVKTVFLQGLMASATPLFFASVAPKLSSPTVFILQDSDEAGYFYHDLTQIMGDHHVLFFPSSYRRAVKYGQRDAANEILRTEVLARLSAIKDNATSGDRRLFVVTCPQALSELVVAQKHLDERRLSLHAGQTIAISQVARQLRELGFHEVDYVYEPGQFALRGSIVDIYSYSSELPYRIDFFGDDIDTIRTFNVEDQLSKDRRQEVEVVPELVSLVTEKVSFFRYLPEDARLVMKDYAYVRDVVERIYNEGFSQQALTERLEGATEQEQAEITRDMNRESSLCPPSQFISDTEPFRKVFFGPVEPSDSLKGESHAKLVFNISPQPLFHKNFDLVRKAFEDYLLQGYQIFILADSKKQQQRLKDIFDEMGSDPERSSLNAQRSEIVFTPVDKTLHEGFADNDLRYCFFTDHQIFDRFHKYNLKSDSARTGKMALTMKELQEMEVGDYIVHVDYGIGKFGGLVRIPLPQRPGQPENKEKQYQEVIRIIYQHNDKVDISIHSLYKISKYRRNDTDEPPRLSALGTGAWERMKERAKKRIKDIARDLIRLYAKRRHERGYAFSADNFMQHELEASFLYEDTPDQLKATQEVKADMEKAQPMDRLICGDVGFGKTEVAIRAAFKAACDSKQVAVLVPTTVLAFQHYQTFRDRLKDFPVRVDYLSRARTVKQTKQVLEDLASGKLDILVGTHKLLGKNVKWHDL